MKTFEFNEHGKCLNPDVIMEIKNKVFVYPILLLEVFEHEGNWYYSLSLATEDYGHHCGGYLLKSPHPKCQFDSRESAINAGIAQIKFDLSSRNSSPKAQQIRNCVANYEKANNRVQLTLNLFQ